MSGSSLGIRIINSVRYLLIFIIVALDLIMIYASLTGTSGNEHLVSGLGGIIFGLAFLFLNAFLAILVFAPMCKCCSEKKKE